jgi:hypothetical protein
MLVDDAVPLITDADVDGMAALSRVSARKLKAALKASREALEGARSAQLVSSVDSGSATRFADNKAAASGRSGGDGADSSLSTPLSTSGSSVDAEVRVRDPVWTRRCVLWASLMLLNVCS